MKRIKLNFLKDYLFILPLIIVVVDLVLHRYLPDKEVNVTSNCYSLVLISLAVIYLLLIVTPGLKNYTSIRTLYYVPLISVIVALFGVWDLATLKSGLLSLPFFPGPEKTIYSFVSDWQLLGKSVLYSLRLVLFGYFIGSITGLISGVILGWSSRGNYWLGPLVKIIGPIPATVWIPISMTVFPNSFIATVFLVALAVWFPVTVLTNSGIANVSKNYYDVARTLGANRNYLVSRVAIPAAAPMIFLSLYAGLFTAFIALLSAEMLGARAGLGWYINWHQGWYEFGKVFACLFILGILVTVFISIFLKAKDWLLVWQKGLIKL
jgi:NitT/TauT family transport system permease protein